MPEELGDELDGHAEVDHPLPRRAPDVMGRDRLEARLEARVAEPLQESVQVAEQAVAGSASMLARVGEQKALLVVDDGDQGVTPGVLRAADVNLRATLEVLGDVGLQGPLERAHLRACRQRESHGGGNVGREEGEETLSLAAPDLVTLGRGGTLPLRRRPLPHSDFMRAQR